jgi:hypothetical protein
MYEFFLQVSSGLTVALLVSGFTACVAYLHSINKKINELILAKEFKRQRADIQDKVLSEIIGQRFSSRRIALGEEDFPVFIRKPQREH